ncbi:DUF3139 domain-containing protein [Brevibacterium sp. JNUCC-42]|nr:DUF3139 domain-containing protein [Brevibacterium sp. JNUCC-42]
MKKFALILIALLLFYLAFYFNTRSHINKLESELRLYLINEKHYSDTEIKSIKAHRGKMPKYWVDVVFNDEPHIVYKYTDRDVGEWHQIAPSASDHNNEIEYKHKEIEPN